MCDIKYDLNKDINIIHLKMCNACPVYVEDYVF